MSLFFSQMSSKTHDSYRNSNNNNFYNTNVFIHLIKIYTKRYNGGEYVIKILTSAYNL